MQRRRLLENKLVVFFSLLVVALILLPIQSFAETNIKNTNYWKFQSNDYIIVLDYLPKELSDAMSRGFSFYSNESTQPIWINRMKFFRPRDVSYVSIDFVNMTIIPDNNHSSFYIYYLIVSGRNAYRKFLFYQQACVLYYKSNDTIPTILTHSNNSINKYKHVWSEKGTNLNNTENQIRCDTKFYNFWTRKTYDLWTSISYNATEVLNEYGEVKIS